MRQALSLHPESRCTAATRIDVDAARRRRGGLVLRFVVTGKIADLRLPPVTSPARKDDLWRHTCFEAFVGATAATVYYEFNFAPSTHWAAYGFEDYRSEMSVSGELNAPRIEVKSTAARYELRASLELDRLPALPDDAPWRLGLSAAIEETNGGMSYWALAHPPGKADFHHADCFAHELPAAWRP